MMRNLKPVLHNVRRYSTLNDKYRLTCGLEIHAQLMTPQKLFSSQNANFNAPPNSQVSYYDAALPGTQPILNPNNLYLALRAAVALNCNIRSQFSFDRKHYFYGDQPTGYQITQHFEPFATDGILNLYPRDLDDGVNKKKKGELTTIPVRIKQIQIEQDTGKSIYIDDTANIDLNRSNHCLIELVTEPDLNTIQAAGAFVRKLQQLLAYLGVCTGEMETGAMRVDVNVSVGQKNANNEWVEGERCEIKNLSTTSAVTHAIKAEYLRQIRDIESGKIIERETRGWDGRNTWKLRSKEDSVDYRYMPDPEVLPVSIASEVLPKLKAEMPELPEDIFKKLLEAPYQVPLRDARTLMTGSAETDTTEIEEELKDSTTPQPTFVLGETGSFPVVDYYFETFEILEKNKAKTKLASNWIVHTLLGELNALSRDSFVPGITVPPVSQFAEMLVKISQKELTSASGKIILKHLLQDPQSTASTSISTIMEEFELTRATVDESSSSSSAQSDVKDALVELCQATIDNFPKIADQIRSGKKPKSIKFLLGQVMRETQGRVDPQLIEETLSQLLKK